MSTRYSSPRSRSSCAEGASSVPVLLFKLSTRTLRPSKSTLPPCMAASAASSYFIPVGLPSCVMRVSLPSGPARGAVTLDTVSLTLIDSDGRKFEADTDTSEYVPMNKDIFLEQVNPGVMKQGETICTVAPGASGFILKAGDTDIFSDKNA